MQKTKYYYDTRFAAHVIREAYHVMKSVQANQNERLPDLMVMIGNERWSFDSLEEFLAEYPKAKSYQLMCRFDDGSLWVTSFERREMNVSVAHSKREVISRVFSVFEQNLEASRIIVPKEPLQIFVGHGHDSHWKELKDHLHEQHDFKVISYEIGPRAGLSVKEVLSSMLNESSFALLLLTAEDEDAYGELHARDNVIHELGLFQGKLGFTRAIAVVEEGIKEFSNIYGLNQIRFGKGRIRETYGDILATIKREFDEPDKQA